MDGVKRPETVMHLDIESLLPWSPGEIKNTKRGPRLLRRAAPTPEFEKVWYANKDWLVANDLSYGRAWKDESKYEACWWADPPAEYMQKKADAMAQSRAVDADVNIPAPPGLEYRPYQRAGIRFALNCIGRLDAVCTNSADSKDEPPT